LFAAGVILWELLTGRRYWEGLDANAIFERLAREELPPNPRTIAPSISEELDAVVARATAASAEDRFATAAEFRHALERACPSATDAPKVLGAMVRELFLEERAARELEIERALGGRAAWAPSEEEEDFLDASEEETTEVVPPRASGRRVKVRRTVQNDAPDREARDGIRLSAGLAPDRRRLARRRRLTRLAWLGTVCLLGLALAGAAAFAVQNLVSAPPLATQRAR
jgi:serine/threonine-protein kinase